jgi:acyl-CoA reductase-like NAD-dependent aldehyde dehydrogenase
MFRPMAVATKSEYGLFIDGAFVEPASGEVHELDEPATGDPLARVAMAGEKDVDRAILAARKALDGAWGRTGATERSRLLHALADAIQASRDELAELETRNAGKPISSTKGEVGGCAEVLRYYAAGVSSIAGSANPMAGSLLFYSLKEPVGVCAQIVPWNYPILMAGWKIAPALAAGCSVVLKPDPQTPLTALRVAELAAEVGFPAGALNVLPADGPVTGSYLVGHAGVDKVAFTGSTATGAEIMRLCASGIKRLTLELGGKSPMIVFADADPAEAVPASTYAFAAGAGQSCECRSRLLVEKPLYDEIVAGVAGAASRIAVGDPLDPKTQLGSLISTRHRARVHGYVEQGVEEGAEVVRGGAVPDGAGAFYPPTVLAAVESTMAVAQEEIFGPVVAAIPFEGEDDAVRIANDSRYGLFATVWTGDPARGHRLAQRLKAGQVGVNTPFTARPGVPFGGYKQSGFGRELALETLEAYLETKSVLVATGTKPANPYGL